MKMPSKCERCDKPAINSPMTMSFFNTDWICMECQVRENRHPDYLPAKLAEIAECQKGNYNFVGIGVPLDLYLNRTEVDV